MPNATTKTLSVDEVKKAIKAAAAAKFQVPIGNVGNVMINNDGSAKVGITEREKSPGEMKSEEDFHSFGSRHGGSGSGTKITTGSSALEETEEEFLTQRTEHRTRTV